jgi:hypothetical protein
MVTVNCGSAAVSIAARPQCRILSQRRSISRGSAMKMKEKFKLPKDVPDMLAGVADVLTFLAYKLERSGAMEPGEFNELMKVALQYQTGRRASGARTFFTRMMISRTASRTRDRKPPNLTLLDGGREDL